MFTAQLLYDRDRCARIPFWNRSWQFQRLHPSEILRLSLEHGLASSEDDPGYAAGCHVMELAAERGFDVEGRNVYEMGEHFSSLADILTTVCRERDRTPWQRPEDISLGSDATWQSSAFLEPSGTRLRRIVAASRWSQERLLAERNSYFSIFEVCAYELPMTMTIFVIGQIRDGRHYSPWTRAYQHPVNKTLRFRFKSRKDSQHGANWEQVWRESVDTSRDAWLDGMREDGVLQEVCFDVEVPVPIAEVRKKVIGHAVRRLREIGEAVDTPQPSPAQCFMPQRCQFSNVCWQFEKSPSEKLGFTPILRP